MPHRKLFLRLKISKSLNIKYQCVYKMTFTNPMLVSSMYIARIFFQVPFRNVDNNDRIVTSTSTIASQWLKTCRRSGVSIPGKRQVWTTLQFGRRWNRVMLRPRKMQNREKPSTSKACLTSRKVLQVSSGNTASQLFNLWLLELILMRS